MNSFNGSVRGSSETELRLSVQCASVSVHAMQAVLILLNRLIYAYDERVQRRPIDDDIECWMMLKL